MHGISTHSFAAKLLLAVSALALTGVLWPSQACAQSSGTDSVAEAARKAREAKNTAPAGKKVYTDDDVKPATPAPPPAQQGPDGANASANAQSQQNTGSDATGNKPADAPVDATADKAADKANDKGDEKSWRAKFKSERDRIAAAEKELDVLQREEDKAQVQYYPDPQKALSEGYSRKDINEKDAKIAAKKDEIAKLKQALSDLEDELRKSGGDPGWSRE